MATPFSILKGSNMIKNKDLEYVNNRYVLTKDYVKNELGMDLQTILYDEFDVNPTTLPDRVLIRTSDAIYEYMQDRCRDFNYACELIENIDTIQYNFKKALGYQLEYFIKYGDLSLENEQSVCKRSLDILKGNGLLDKRRPPSLNICGEYRK